MSANTVTVTLPAEALKPLITQVVEELLGQLEADRARLSGDRVAYPEAEAARLLSLTEDQLRGERRKGRITGSIGPNKRILYTRADLLAYLAGRRTKAAL